MATARDESKVVATGGACDAVPVLTASDSQPVAVRCEMDNDIECVRQ